MDFLFTREIGEPYPGQCNNRSVTSEEGFVSLTKLKKLISTVPCRQGPYQSSSSQQALIIAEQKSLTKSFRGQTDFLYILGLKHNADFTLMS